jgi:hypothetical protein
VAQPRVAMYRRVGAIVAAFVALLAMPWVHRPATAAPRTSGLTATGRVVLIGVPGLRWNDIRETGTPNLWRLAGLGSTATLSVKTVASHTCPIDGWLTVSAGQRAQLRHGSCGLPPAPNNDTVPGFGGMRDDNARNKFRSRLGLLGDAVHRAGACTMAVGPGAVVGAADGTGRVDAYARSIDQLPPDGWSRCALTVVDVDDVFRAYVEAGVDVNGHQVKVDGRERAAAARRADDRVGTIMSAVPPGTTVLLAGMSDDSSTPHLHVAMATGPGYRAHRLTADSTRTDGLVTLTDVTATVLRSLGVPKPREAVGSPWRDGGPKPAATRAVVRELAARDTAAQAFRRLVLPFTLTLALVQVALYAFATFALRQKRRQVLAATRILALGAASLPAAAFLANLVPWWSSGYPAVVMVLEILVAMAALTAVAAAGPWRRSVTGAGAVVGGVTALVLTLDVMTGNHLQTCSMLGYTPIVAGRFYGFANTSWALWITGLIIATGALASRVLGGPHERRNGWYERARAAARERLPAAGRLYERCRAAVTGRMPGGRRHAAAGALVVAAGLVALVIDGAPTLGADFGGIIAVIPGFAVFAFMVTGTRIRPSRLLAVLAVGAVVVLAVSFADSLRADPTHIGEFWDSLWNGDAGTIVARKFRGMLGTFGNWELTLIAVLATGFLFFALRRPLAWRAAALHTAYERDPGLRPTLVAVLVTAGVGMLVNDSGVAIPAMASTVAIPLALAASVRALELGLTGSPSRSEPAESASSSMA